MSQLRDAKRRTRAFGRGWQQAMRSCHGRISCISDAFLDNKDLETLWDPQLKWRVELRLQKERQQRKLFSFSTGQKRLLRLNRGV